MASSSGCCLNPKQSKSIYTEDWKWRDKPTIRNPSNNIYTPYRKRDMQERLMKHDKKVRGKKRKLRKGSSGMKRSSSTYGLSRQSSEGYGEEEGREEEYYRTPQYSSSRGSRRKRPSTAGGGSRYSLSSYGAGSIMFDDNPTYSDFYSDVSEKTNKLKKTLYGKRFGNYINKPLCETADRAKPKVRSRNSRNFRKKPANMPVSKDLKEYYENKYFKESLYFDDRTKRVPKRTGDNQVIEKLAKERKKILRDDNLFEGMMKLKRLNLLKKHKHNVRVSKHHPTKGYAYNDYHDKLTKDGYARNTLGTFYYR